MNIACSLPDGAARDQLGEWRHLLRASVTSVERSSRSEVLLSLRSDPQLITSVIQLAQREKACCPFFEFTLHIDAQALVLRINAPEDAAPLLDAIAPQLD